MVRVLADLVDRTCSLPWSSRGSAAASTGCCATCDRSVGADGQPSELPCCRFADVRRLIGGLLEGTGGRRSAPGAITCCSLSPLRSVPARVSVPCSVSRPGRCPRARRGDDLMALAPRVGDRDPRSETRQLLLGAVMSARARW